jgi:hypothetical protein
MSHEISDGKAGAADYWAAMYDRQCKEVAVNEYEKEFLYCLGNGMSIIGTIKVLEEKYGVSAVEGARIFDELKARCNEWEKRNML